MIDEPEKTEPTVEEKLLTSINRHLENIDNSTRITKNILVFFTVLILLGIAFQVLDILLRL